MDANNKNRAAPEAEQTPEVKPEPHEDAKKTKAETKKHSRAEEEFDAVKKQAVELKDRLLRTAAEYDNYRKRTEKEKSQSVDYGISKAVLAILPVLDNLERAYSVDCKDEEFKKGIGLTIDGFVSSLKSLGVEPIEALGKQFDPELHAAAQQLEAEGAESGQVTAVLQKGYTLQGKVVRHATVAVAP